MKRIVLDMQSTLYARQMERALLQELDNWQVVIAEEPSLTADICKTYMPSVLLMEVTCYTPWRLSERMEVRSKVKRNCPDCKIILTVEERADKELAEQVKAAKRDGLIDAFIFLSMTDKYLTALLDTL